MKRTLAILAVALVALLVSREARAHAIGLSRGDYVVDDATVRAEIVLRSDDARAAAPGLARDEVRSAFVDTLVVESGGARCPGALDDAAPDPPDGLRIRATFACLQPAARLHVRLGFLDRLPAGHRHLAVVHAGDRTIERLADRASPDVDVGAPHGFASLLRAGVEHILTGWDHLAFLLALLLGGTLVGSTESLRARAGALVAMLTAFTVGHSASLAIATLGGFAPGARFVEPAVALSVAYVGAENLWARSVRHRWMITLPFGFVHGFALAGGLLPLGLPRAQLPGALLAFNLGVECGQIAMLAVVLPLLAWIGARAAWYPRAARVISGAIVVAGVVGFGLRV